MAIKLNEETRGKLPVVGVHGRLHQQGYSKFVPESEQEGREHGKLRVLLQMKDFQGWDADGLWEDIKFDARQYSDIKPVALVGDEGWQKNMALLCKPFTSAQIRHVDTKELSVARHWIAQESNEPASSL